MYFVRWKKALCFKIVFKNLGFLGLLKGTSVIWKPMVRFCEFQGLGKLKCLGTILSIHMYSESITQHLMLPLKYVQPRM